MLDWWREMRRSDWQRKVFGGKKFAIAAAAAAAETPPVQIMPIWSAQQIYVSRVYAFVYRHIGIPMEGHCNISNATLWVWKTTTQNAVHRIMNRFNNVTMTTCDSHAAVHIARVNTQTHTHSKCIKMSVMTCNLFDAFFPLSYPITNITYLIFRSHELKRDLCFIVEPPEYWLIWVNIELPSKIVRQMIVPKRFCCCCN